MPFGLTRARYEEVSQALAHMEAYLVALAQEIRDTTAPAARHSHVWLQAENAVHYARSLRVALHREEEGWW